MPQQTKIFRLFVSSTFTDMKTERKLLQEKIFPELEEFCRQNGARFQAIDLRWGVSEESQRDQKTMEICLNEIRRCQQITPKPNFLILLGDRYGWQPVPAKIPQAEMDLLLPLLSTEVNKRVYEWYKLDANAVPSEYVLQPRRGSFTDYARWQFIETELLLGLRAAALKVGFDKKALIKYTTSATHQEIIHGALNPLPEATAPEEHVFALSRTINNLPEDATATDFIDLNEKGLRDGYSKIHLNKLKDKLTKKLGRNFIEYSVDWNGGEKPFTAKDGFDENKFVELVVGRLKAVIKEQLKVLIDKDELQMEIRYHKEFALSLTSFFTGRQFTLDEIQNYLNDSQNNKVLALIGASGSGKTCVMARALELADSKNAILLARFIGANAKSSNLLCLLSSICSQIAQAYGKTLLDLAEDFQKDRHLDYNALTMILPKCLALATRDKPLILFLDALDQLSESDDAKSLHWLPRILPAHVHLIVTALPELESLLFDAQILHLPLMLIAEGEALLAAWLKSSGRQLTADQKKEVLNKFQQCGLPLFLKLVFEQVRLWHSYDHILPMSDTVPEMINHFFEALESEHYKELVAKVVGYILSGKDKGLTEDEILDMLVIDDEHWHYFTEKVCYRDHKLEVEEAKKLPMVIWSRLFLDLSPYLTERDSYGECIISFYHRQFNNVLHQKYQANPKPIHNRLGNYFSKQPNFFDGVEKKTPNVRKCVEQLWQQSQTENSIIGIEETLIDFDFLEAKIKATLFINLIEDFQTALQYNPNSEKLLEFEAFLQRNTHILTKRPSLLFQEAINLNSDNIVREIAQKRWRSQIEKRPWICLLNIKPTQKAYLKTFTDHASWVYTCSWSPNGKHLLSGGADNTLIINEISTGRPVFSRSILHKDCICASAWSPDGNRFVTGSDDGELYIWNFKRGLIEYKLRHEYGIRDCCWSTNGKYIVSVSAGCKNTIKIWDAQGGKLVSEMSEHKDNVLSCAWHPKLDLLVTSSEDKCVKLWALNSKKSEFTISNISGFPQACSWSPDGSMIAYSSVQEIILFDIFAKTIKKILKGHTGTINSTKWSADAKFLLSASSDRTLRIWDIDNGKEIEILRGHTNSVTDCDWNKATGLIGSTSEDKSVKIWRPYLIKTTLIQQLHEDQINDCSWSPDGQLVVTAAWGGPIKIVNLNSDRTLNFLSVGQPESSYLACDWNSAGNHIAFGMYNQTILVIPTDSKTNVTPFEFIESTNSYPRPIWTCRWSPDGQYLLTAAENSTLTIWSLKEKKKYLNLMKYENNVENTLFTSCCWSPDGKYVISSSSERPLEVWDVRNGKKLFCITDNNNLIRTCKCSPDGKLILSGGSDSKLKIWNITTGECIQTLVGHEGTVNKVFWGFDGRLVYSVSDDQTLLLWNIKRVNSDLMFYGPSTAIAIDPYNQIIVAGNGEGNIFFLKVIEYNCISHKNKGSQISRQEESCESFQNFSNNDRPLIITPVRLWIIDLPWDKAHWADDITALCGQCKKRFIVPGRILDAINAIGRSNNILPEDSSCFKLPDDAWNEQILFSECPNCGKKVKYNPFIVDNSILN